MATSSNIWQDDRLGRQTDGETVYRFIMSQIKSRRERRVTASYVLNIDAEWGHGKSFFLNRFATQLESAGHVVAQINAWENDLTNEPMIAVMAAIEDALKPHIATKDKVRRKWNALVKASAPLAVSLAKGITTSFLKRHTGDFLDDVDARLGSPDDTIPASTEPKASVIGEGVSVVVEKIGDDLAAGLIDAHRKHLTSIKTFRENLALIGSSIRSEQNPDALIFVLVDELDRCRPNHAIHLLESIKHLFNTDGIVFIVATNTSQLSASVKAVYGNDFNSKAYLLRFFDRTFRFKKVDNKTFIRNLFESYGIDQKGLDTADLDSVQCSSTYFDAFNLSLRDIEQCFDIFATMYALWDFKVPLQLPLVWPLICSHHAGKLDLFDYLSGEQSDKPEDDYFKSNPPLFQRDEHDITSHRIVRRTATVQDVTGGYIKGYKISLIDLAHNNSGSLPYQVAYSYFTYEFSALHRNQANRNDPPFSVISLYGDYVRLAVQFKNPEGDISE